MLSVVRTLDRNQTAADVDKMFENLLRFKKQNIKRDKSRGDRPQNLPTSRNRIPASIAVNSASTAINTASIAIDPVSIAVNDLLNQIAEDDDNAIVNNNENIGE